MSVSMTFNRKKQCQLTAAWSIIFTDQIEQMFGVARRKVGIRNYGNKLSAAAFRRPLAAELPLFS
jgi:hypothetical protein